MPVKTNFFNHKVAAALLISADQHIYCYNDIDYYFEFRGIFYAVNEILSNADNASSCVFKFNPEFIVDEVSIK